MPLLKSLFFHFTLLLKQNTSELFLGNSVEKNTIKRVTFHGTKSIIQILEVSGHISLHLRLSIENIVMSAEYHIKTNMTKINTSSIKRPERWSSCPCFILITFYSRALKSLHLKIGRAGVSRCIHVHAQTCWKKELLWISSAFVRYNDWNTCSKKKKNQTKQISRSGVYIYFYIGMKNVR